MAPSKKIFWLLVFLFTFAVIGYSGWIYRSTNVKPVSYTSQIEEFEESGVPGFGLPILKDHSSVPTGEFLKLQNLEDKIILINYWASWCAPCQAEFPSLLALAKKYEDPKAQGGPQKLRVVAISVDSSAQLLNDFLSLIKGPIPSNFVVVADPDGNIAAKYGTKKLPESYIINRDHKLLRKVIDAQNWTSPAFLSFLEQQWSASP